MPYSVNRHIIFPSCSSSISDCSSFNWYLAMKRYDATRRYRRKDSFPAIGDVSVHFSLALVGTSYAIFIGRRWRWIYFDCAIVSSAYFLEKFEFEVEKKKKKKLSLYGQLVL